MSEKDFFSSEIMIKNQELYDKFFCYLNFSKEKLLCLKPIFEEKITESSMRNIIEDIPCDWLPSKQNIETMLKYILYRISHIDDICNTIEFTLNERKEIY